ncbi:small multi-drug export protein [Persicobacter psychrovividus]|uniref:Small multi-drug export protein n=1 Tax=Persicobacter psychrovividus TaxID=387638 RepID=A0ABN6L4F9_9BACT|nr:hypothetical protein PEPS_02710 [Persicobacter psychrovividus]
MSKYIPVYLISMIKFIGGPALGSTLGLTYWETVALSVLGMMTSVVIISFFGLQLRRFMQRKKLLGKKKFSPRSRRFVFIWKTFGLWGVAFLTPVFFSPIVGTLLAALMGASRPKLWAYMFISSVFWSLSLSYVVHSLL